MVDFTEVHFAVELGKDAGCTLFLPNNFRSRRDCISQAYGSSLSLAERNVRFPNENSIVFVGERSFDFQSNCLFSRWTAECPWMSPTLRKTHFRAEVTRVLSLTVQHQVNDLWAWLEPLKLHFFVSLSVFSIPNFITYRNNENIDNVRPKFLHREDRGNQNDVADQTDDDKDEGQNGTDKGCLSGRLSQRIGLIRISGINSDWPITRFDDCRLIHNNQWK